jgi:hypothetical protein
MFPETEAILDDWLPVAPSCLFDDKDIPRFKIDGTPVFRFQHHADFYAYNSIIIKMMPCGDNSLTHVG